MRLNYFANLDVGHEIGRHRACIAFRNYEYDLPTTEALAKDRLGEGVCHFFGWDDACEADLVQLGGLPLRLADSATRPRHTYDAHVHASGYGIGKEANKNVYQSEAHCIKVYGAIGKGHLLKRCKLTHSFTWRLYIALPQTHV